MRSAGSSGSPTARPVRATSVRAVDRDLRSEQMLGQARTDAAGAYRIAYLDEQFRKRERGSADLVVKALAADVRCSRRRRCCSTPRPKPRST